MIDMTTRDLSGFTVEQVIEYINAVTELGEMRPNYARALKVAIRRVSGILPSGTALETMRQKLDEVVTEWARRENVKPYTASTYLSRCKSAITAFANLGADAFVRAEP